MAERRGVLTFLAVTFGLTYLIEGVLILSGFRLTSTAPSPGQFVILGVMWVPALAAVLTVRYVTGDPVSSLYLRFGPWQPYLLSAVLIALAFVLIYGSTWLLGLGQPDWTLDNFQALMAAADPDFVMPPPSLVLGGLTFATLVMGSLVNSLFGLGEELGWRGFLLPRLMPLGKLRAYLLLGLIWGLWHLPLLLVGFVYPGRPLWGTLAFIATLTAFGAFMNELTLRHKSAILAGWMHGVFNSHKLGLWALLFPVYNPLLGGYAGLVGIVVWAGLAIAVTLILRRPSATDPAQVAGGP